MVPINRNAPYYVAWKVPDTRKLVGQLAAYERRTGKAVLLGLGRIVALHYRSSLFIPD